VQQGAVTGRQRIRRNSLTTLHSLPIRSTAGGSLPHAGSRQQAPDRRMSVPHGCSVYISHVIVL